jgi:hypothetical protein
VREEEEEERKSESEADLQETTIQQMIRALEEDDAPAPLKPNRANPHHLDDQQLISGFEGIDLTRQLRL